MAMLTITPSTLKGSVKIPPSKSHTMRALLLGSLGEGETQIHNYLHSPDTQALLHALRLFGVSAQVTEKTITLVGRRWNACEDVINAGNSGQVLRFVGGLAALLPSYTLLTGDTSLRHQRPLFPLITALTQLNAFAASARLDGKAPLIVRGPLKSGKATLAGEDSQPVSALLMATSFLEGTTHLHVTNPGETPWIDLTLSWLQRLGGDISHSDYTHYTIHGPLRYAGFHSIIPGDFSSAAFPLVAALITRSQLNLENLNPHDIQGDKKLIDLLKTMGAALTYRDHTLYVDGSAPLRGTTIDANAFIDALPILAVVGCFAEGSTEIINAAIARHKESDRIHAITTELKKMGARIEETPEGLRILPSKLSGAALTSHADHRIAMALIVAALAASSPSSLAHSACIAKSYPSFLTDFQKIGACIE